MGAERRPPELEAKTLFWTFTESRKFAHFEQNLKRKMLSFQKNDVIGRKPMSQITVQ